MNDLYGIDPKAPSNLQDLSSLLRLFGPSDGRFIADFPAEWRHELFDHMKSLSDLNQKAVVEWLNLSRHSILPTTSRYKANLSWAENAATLYDQAKSLIGPSGSVSNMVEPIDHVLSDPRAFPDASGEIIPFSIQAYLTAARPILMVSRKIVLIDPYFNLRPSNTDYHSSALKAQRHRKVLSAFLEVAVQSKQCEAFEIYHAPKKSVDTVENKNELISIATTVGASNMALNVYPDEELHARYLLGMRNGLHFDQGFDTNIRRKGQPVKWLGKGILEEILKRFT